MPNLKEHAEFVKNMDALEQTLASPNAMEKVDICGTYAKVKPLLLLILPILEKIPVVGQVAAAIRLLMTIADSFCKV